MTKSSQPNRWRVYVAGPISKGDQLLNLKAGIDAGNRLMSTGYIAPFVPHLNYTAYMMDPETNTYDAMLECDFTWISACHGLLRLPGESRGADMEVGFAYEQGIPVFFDEKSCVLHFSSQRARSDR